VLYVPGQFCYVNDLNNVIPTHEARLSFGVVPKEGLREGVRRLARAFAKVARSVDRNGTITPAGRAETASIGLT
jgi:hypothetical protein